jgi:hypothetical protein
MMVDLAFGLNYSAHLIKKPASAENNNLLSRLRGKYRKLKNSLLNIEKDYGRR